MAERNPNLKYTYKFANGEKTNVEVSEKMLAVLQNEDRIENNNEQKNSRRPGRFIHMDATGPDGKYMEIADPKTLDPTEGEKRLEVAISQLSDNQRRLLQATYFDGVSIVEYARREGISQSAISQQLQTIRKKLKKILADPYI